MAKPKMGPKRPLIGSAPVDPYGEVPAGTPRAAGPMSPDYTYVPGWSELRHAHEEAAGAFSRREITRDKVPILPGKVHIHRRMTTGGQEDGMKLMAARNNGARPITKEDIGQPWFKQMPPGARYLPSGEIVTAAGDGIYMWYPQAAAARNHRRKQEASRKSVEDAGLLDDSSGAVTMTRSTDTT